jgi:hypothetical protein
MDPLRVIVSPGRVEGISCESLKAPRTALSGSESESISQDYGFPISIAIPIQTPIGLALVVLIILSTHLPIIPGFVKLILASRRAWDLPED